MLGVSVYPYKEDIEKIIEYIGVDGIRYDRIFDGDFKSELIYKYLTLMQTMKN